MSTAAYYVAHRDEVLAQHAARRAANPEKARAYDRAWADAHREERRAGDRARHAADPEKYRALSRARNAMVRKRNVVDLRAYKLLNGCIDCGYDENADALELDHVRGMKRFNCSTAMSGDKILREEIAKCEVRCANCHSIRTLTTARLDRRAN